MWSSLVGEILDGTVIWRECDTCDESEQIYMDDPQLALVGDTPHVIDEWQDIPAIWNIVRHRIDDSANKPGQFILTGSSTPPEDEKRHSGAGRIARLRIAYYESCRDWRFYGSSISFGTL